jgi:hypothetical protein
LWRSLGESDFTTPWVPTGIKTGVSITEWSVSILPVRANEWPSSDKTVNFNLGYQS